MLLNHFPINSFLLTNTPTNINRKNIIADEPINVNKNTLNSFSNKATNTGDAIVNAIDNNKVEYTNNDFRKIRVCFWFIIFVFKLIIQIYP